MSGTIGDARKAQAEKVASGQVRTGDGNQSASSSYTTAPAATISAEERRLWRIQGNVSAKSGSILRLLDALEAAEAELRDLKNHLWERDVDHQHAIDQLQIDAEVERGEMRAKIARIEAFADNLSCERTARAECEHANCCATSQLRHALRSDS